MPKASSNRALLILLAYLWPLAIVPLLVEKRDAEVRWHARNGLLLMAAEAAFFAVSWFAVALVTLTAFRTGVVLSVLVVLVWIAVLTLHLAAIVKGWNGGRLTVPRLSDLADRF
jgi:uncharacterized membrane protein